MMSLEVIESLANERARRAKNKGIEPKLVVPEWVEWDATKRQQFLKGMPNIGSYVPKGWYQSRMVLVDKFEVGDKGRSLSLPELCEWIKPGEGLAIIEEGQFQVVVCAFGKGRKPTGHETEKGVGIHRW
jgi:hypothetical protein